MVLKTCPPKLSQSDLYKTIGPMQPVMQMRLLSYNLRLRARNEWPSCSFISFSMSSNIMETKSPPLQQTLGTLLERFTFMHLAMQMRSMDNEITNHYGYWLCYVICTMAGEHRVLGNDIRFSHEQSGKTFGNSGQDKCGFDISAKAMFLISTLSFGWHVNTCLNV